MVENITGEKAKEIVLSILEKKQGATIAEIVNNWFEPPARPSSKPRLVADAIIDLIQDGEVFFQCEKPSVRTLILGETPYRYFTKSKLSRNEIV